VASGDPLPDRVILWTRVSPSEEATPGSGVGPAMTVTWEVAATSDFSSMVASGEVSTDSTRDHTVKVDPSGLPSASWLYYRFRCGGQISPTGRTRTAPARGDSPHSLRFGVASCSFYASGYFSAYRHLADKRDLDAVIHLGDYIYEYGKRDVDVRAHRPSHEVVSLADYRMRHAQYKQDADAQRLHARVPWICTWDDHESANNAWIGGAENHQAAEGNWQHRRQASEQAYFEWMPVRPESSPTGRHIYRRLAFGDLVELSMLDLRTYRTAPSGSATTGRPVWDERGSTVTGPDQFRWLKNGIRTSSARWKVVGNPVLFMPVLLPPLDRSTMGAVTDLLGVPPEGASVVGGWDGYRNDQVEMTNELAEHNVKDVVFLTGDIHTAWAADIPRDAAAYPQTGSVATEFVVPSVTSDSIGDVLGAAASEPVSEGVKALNHHVHYMNPSDHGYGVLTVMRQAAQMDWYFVSDRTRADSGEKHGVSFRVAAGTQRARRVSSPVR
jgi:alkaline phosphatase D